MATSRAAPRPTSVIQPIFVDTPARAGRGFAIHRWIAGGIVRIFPYLVFFWLAVEAAIAYRLWSQVMGNTQGDGLSRLFFNASLPLIEPFRKYDPLAPTEATPAVDMAAVYAFEAYLIAAIGISLFTAICAIVARKEPWVYSIRVVLSPVGLIFAGISRVVGLILAGAWYLIRFGALALWLFLTLIASKGYRAVLALAAYVRTRDWPRYRARTATALRAADGKLEKAVIAVGGREARQSYLRTSQEVSAVATHKAQRLLSASSAQAQTAGSKLSRGVRDGLGKARNGGSEQRGTVGTSDGSAAASPLTGRRVNRRGFLHLPTSRS